MRSSLGSKFGLSVAAASVAVIGLVWLTPGSKLGASVRFDGSADKITATGGTIDFDNENLVTTGTMTAGSLTISGLDCTANASGGALTASAAGVVTCSDDDAGSGGVAAIIVGSEPFMFSNADTYTIGSSSGSLERNRMVAPRAGTLRNLFLVPDQQPAVSSSVDACINVNGSDTSLCVTGYDSLDWNAGPAFGNTVDSVVVAQGDLISVHMTGNSTSADANFRPSFEFE